MKKYIIGILIIIFILLIIIFPKEKKVHKSNTYSFYKSEYKERYDNYQKQHQDLKRIDVITRVNLNLDKEFYTDVQKSKYLNTENILVNKYNYLDSDYIPNNLEIIDDCSSKTNYLVHDANVLFKKLCNDIKNDGLNLRVISSYRDYYYQKKLYDNYVLNDGIKNADTYSARAGFSEHQTGLVIDVDDIRTDYNNFEDTDSYKWMINNSYKYGFILRYPVGMEEVTGYSYESWHYRYVGVDIAKYIYENNITFDEYYARFLQK